jgi:hypothetical protein
MRTYFISLLAALLLAFTGCTTSNSLQPVAAQLAVQYATLKVLEDHPEYGPRIIEITQHVRAVASGDAAATVSVIDSLIRSQIDWKKLNQSPADALMVNTLLLAIRSELETRIGNGIIDEKAMLTIAQVAGWIEEAAASTVPRTG